MNKGYFSSAAYAQLFIMATRRDPEKLLAGTGMTLSMLEELDYVPAETLAALMRNIDKYEAGSGWAAHVGEQLNIAAHGPLGFAALSAPTLGAALEVMVQFHAARITGIATELQLKNQRIQFLLRDLTGDDRYARWVSETVLKVIESLIETIMGHPVGENVLISFTGPAPDYQETLKQLYGAPCEFGASHNAISIPRSWMQMRSPLYDESMYRANIAKCREIIDSQQGNDDPVQKVRNILSNHFEQVAISREIRAATPSLEWVADSLHITPRTLIRYLRQQDTTFRQLLEVARVACAEELLQRAELTVAEVAVRLGYSDPANFGRAFRQWKGISPAAWRRQG